ncbi:SET and MYND domain-containing protein 4 isoform X2 [Hoplias malabaricus]|uniref:SET and MYND domain-containing protein 4 isoform X2 n=1 Tax=Hoplias malabaricus TaxID=27720 RepID=UPI003462F33F
MTKYNWKQHVEQKWTQLGNVKKEFSLLSEIETIFNFAQTQIQQEDLKTLCRISERYPVKKSVEYATKFKDQGNLSFKNNDYTSAALYYSKGVCHARKNTEQLSLCYANRSAALFHLGLYNKCLEDIQRAFDEGYPSHLQRKLLDRRKKCVDQLKEQKQSKVPSSEHQAQQTADEKDAISCLPAGISVQFSPEKGRHLLATDKKSAGEVLFKDKAFCFVLIPGDGHHTKTSKGDIFGTEHRYCHHCLCQTLSIVPCVGCSYAQYCGQWCAAEAWRQYHSWECPIGSELLALGVLAHLALRMALKAELKVVQRARGCHFRKVNVLPGAALANSDVKNEQSGSLEENLYSLSELNIEQSSSSSDYLNCYYGTPYLGIYSLLPHVLNHSPSLRFLLAFTMAMLCERLKEVESLPEIWQCCEQESGSMLGSTALRHMMQLRCNAQAVTAIRVKENTRLAVQSTWEVRIATAVFPLLSLLNHSCCPNTSISFSLGLNSDVPAFSASGVTVTIRTSKDVSAGDELLHCYGPHCRRLDVMERQRLLFEQYFFHCYCKACETELAAGNWKLASASYLKCEKCGNSLQESTHMHMCSLPFCGYQISNVELQRRIQKIQSHLDQAFELLENYKLDRALNVLKGATTQADCILMKMHPVQGKLADATARVYATIGDWKEAASHLKHSITAVRSQYGEDSVELGQQLFKLTQVYFNGRDRQSALSVISRAQHLLSLHCDLHSEELQELQQIEACLHAAVSAL